VPDPIGSLEKQTDAMSLDRKLAPLVLAQLAKREVGLEPGASVLVQPAIPGMHVENPMAIPGYNHDQIDGCLRSLAMHGYIGTGHLSIDAAMIGIYFGGITAAGRLMMPRAA
jgi:hypothetical protein